MIWLVIANTNSCRIFEYHKDEKKISLLSEFNHEASKLKGIDLVSDRPGHYKTEGSAHGVFIPREDPKEIEIESFAHDITKVLDHGRTTNQFKNIILVLPPHMDGLVHKLMNNPLKRSVLETINKDYAYLKEHEILDTLMPEFNRETLKVLKGQSL